MSKTNSKNLSRINNSRFKTIKRRGRAENIEPLMLYKMLYGEAGLWVGPAGSFNGISGQGTGLFSRVEYND